MGRNTKISWTNDTLNALHGCKKVSGGCLHCYAVAVSNKLADNPNAKIQEMYAGVTTRHENGQLDWSGVITFVERKLWEPMSWQAPRRIFVNSLSDLFYEEVLLEWIAAHWALFALTPWHTYQVLTKRPERIRPILEDPKFTNLMQTYIERYRPKVQKNANLFSADTLLAAINPVKKPLPNVWLGTSVEDQVTAIKRIPHLLNAPAAIRFLSCEPLLGYVQLDALSVNRKKLPFWHGESMSMPGELNSLNGEWWPALNDLDKEEAMKITGVPKIDWIIVGGESGHGARKMENDWAVALLQQSKMYGTTFYGKQTGSVVANRYGLSGKGEGPVPRKLATWVQEDLAWLNVQNWPDTEA